jgi:hypothetical protein
MPAEETFFGRTSEELGDLSSTPPARYLRRAAALTYSLGGFSGLALFLMNMMRHASKTLENAGGNRTEVEALSAASDGFFIVSEQTPPEVVPLVGRTMAVLSGEDEALLQHIGRTEEFQKSYVVVELLLREGAEHAFLIIAISGMIMTTDIWDRYEKAYLNAVGNYWEDVWAEMLTAKPKHPWSVS